MKILIFVDDYIPNSKKICAKMMHELAIEMMKNNHEVNVITPSSEIKNKYEKEIYSKIIVYKFRSGKIKNTNKILRAYNELLLSNRASAALRDLFKSGSFDFIIYYSPSIFFGSIIKRLKKKWNIKSYLILRDIFPQWAIDTGILKEKSVIVKVFKYYEKLNYEAADIIALQSQGNKQWFESNYKISGKKIEVLYNWIKEKNIKNTGKYRERFNLQDKIIFFYGGNIGHAQDMRNLIRLAERMKTNNDAHFLFCGKGDEFDLILNLKENNELKNLTILPAVSQEEYEVMLSEANVGLFSLDRSHKTHNFPGKLLGYMNANIPILGSVNPNNDIKEIVEKYNAGFISVNGEDEKFYQNAVKLLDSETRKRMGHNVKILLKDNFSVNNAYKTISASFK